jgi:hypothetical protein
MAGPALDFELPNFKDKNWRAFEKIIGAPLNGGAQSEIEKAAEQYSIARYFEKQDKQRRGQRGRIDSKGKTKKNTNSLALRTAIKRLIKKWGEVQADPLAKRVIEIYSDELVGAGKRDMDTVMADLQFHQVALSLYLNQPKGDGLFDRFVGRLAAVYEAAKKKPATITMPTDLGDPDAKVSAFVEFVMAVDTCLPISSQRTGVHTISANSKAVLRALNKYKGKGKLPPKP